MVKRGFTERWVVLGLIFATAVLLSLDLPRPGLQWLAFALIALWPMWSWSRVIEADELERLLFGGAASLLLNMLWALLLIFSPGEVHFTLRLLGPILIAILPLWKTAVFPDHTLAFTKREWAWVGLVLLLVVGLRFYNLAYSEFQGDEGVIMVRAASILTGDHIEMFLHQKGPAEILLPISFWGLSREINEFWARILFSWAGILSVVATMAVARRWFGRSTAILAGLLLAIVGFSIGFSRIVQYQSLVVLWGAMALLCAIRYSQTNRLWDLGWSALFIASGLLAHYDAVLAVPAIVWLLAAHVAQTRQLVWRHWIIAAGMGATVLAVFYVPFFMNSNFGRTGQYLLGARLGVSESTGIFSWSGLAFWRMITLYNSTYFILGLLVVLLVGIWVALRFYRNIAAVLYFFVPLLFYLFIVVDPRTHVYTIFPGAVILGALGIICSWHWIPVRPKSIRYVVLACFGLWFMVSAIYVYWMFVDNSPERMRTWEENKPKGYWTTWETPPLYGLFGFPHQAGWRVVRDLMANSDLPYASNEEEEITNWYMQQAPRTHCANYASFVMAEDVQDAVPYDAVRLADFPMMHKVMINGRSTMKIFTQDDVTATQTYDAANESLWLTPDAVIPSVFAGKHPVGTILGDEQVQLLGYDIDAKAPFPGSSVTVTLYWQALKPFEQNYQVFVHFYDDGLVAQHDGSPECNVMPTTRWEPGQIIVDPHILQISDEVRPGEVQVVTGMYHLITQERLQVPSISDNVIELQNLRIEEREP